MAKKAAKSGTGTIRVGIGGWTFEPWRGVFYPADLVQRRELEFASRKLSSIEINGTYYSSFKPDSWRKWRDETPDDFVFSVKASRFCTNRKQLADGAASVEKFLTQGLTRLGDRLGPILWQFMATKKFETEDFGAFLKLLPEAQDGVKLRHAVQVRHESFAVPEFVAMCRAAEVAIVFADSPQYPGIADVTGDFVYARLEAGEDENPLCYPEEALPRWTAAARCWASSPPSAMRW